MPIPFQGEPIQAFNQGVGQGNELFRTLLARKQMQRQAQQHAQNLALQQTQEQRLGRAEDRHQLAAPLERQKLELQTNPEMQAQHKMALFSHLKNIGAFQGIPEDTLNAYRAKMVGGIDPYAESPAQRRQAELENSITLENLKASNKAAYPTQGTPIKPTDLLADWAYINNLEDQLGSEDPRVIDAKRLFKLKEDNLSSQIGKRNLPPGEVEEQKIDSRERAELRRDLPQIAIYLKDVNEAIDTLENDPVAMKSWFGKPAGLTEEQADDLRNSQINDPRKGALDTIFGNLVGPQEMEFSSKGAVAALNFARTLKPNYNNPYFVTLGKLYKIRDKFTENYAKAEQLSEKLGPSYKEKKEGNNKPKESKQDFSQYSDEDLQAIAGEYVP